MLTSPITSPYFHSRVLSLVSTYLTENPDETSTTPPAPIIPPLNPVDTPLTPGDIVSQIIAYSSPWIDLCSPDPLISNISRQVLNIEIAYASFCGVANVIIPGPRNYSSRSIDSDGLVQYARAIQEALMIGSYVQIAIHIPMYVSEEVKAITGDLRGLARTQRTEDSEDGDVEASLYETWDAWNLIRSLCTYNSRLTVGKIQNKSFQFPWLPSRGVIISNE
jgi:protein arginine N-methyltransferase 5